MGKFDGMFVGFQVLIGYNNIACILQLLKLQRLDATNDAFFIWHYGSMATINNLRIGLLPSHELDWREVNAALGHAALMLLVVANRLEYRLEPYIVIPMGSFSSVARHGDEQNADPLYVSIFTLVVNVISGTVHVFISGTVKVTQKGNV